MFSNSWLQKYHYFHEFNAFILNTLRDSRPDINFSKLYYSIGEVAEIFGVNRSLIRFWEKEFSIIQPRKNKNGNRVFTVKDLENFNKIFTLVKTQGFTLEGAKKALKSKDLPAQNPEESKNVIQRLEAIRERLIELKKDQFE